MTEPLLTVVVYMNTLLCLAGMQAQALLPGTVLVSRNLEESQNTSPGYWNHLAIYVGHGECVEAQQGQGVIRTPMSQYWQRPIEYRLLAPVTPEIGAAAAENAQRLVGRDYGRFASVGPGWRFGRHNCVSVVEQAYRPLTQRPLMWGIRRPDDIYKIAR